MNYKVVCIKIARNIGSILQSYSVFTLWLILIFAIIYDYFYEKSHPPTGFIPSSYHPPNATLVIILLAIMVAELRFAYWALDPWEREGRIVRVVFLSIFNFFWILVSAFISGTRPATPLVWHFAWLLLLEVILFLDIAILSIGSVVRYLYRVISRFFLK